MTDLTIRAARHHDALDSLAALDSAAPLTGEVIVAEVAGRPVAAIEVATGRTVADPFERTTDVVALLRLRARGAPAARRRARRARLHLRAA